MKCEVLIALCIISQKRVQGSENLVPAMINKMKLKTKAPIATHLLSKQGPLHREKQSIQMGKPMVAFTFQASSRDLLGLVITQFVVKVKDRGKEGKLA
jgi:hypothetical protein